MKCLDKKRIKMKQGETLAINERIMLSLVSTGVCSANPLIWFPFQTHIWKHTKRLPKKLCCRVQIKWGICIFKIISSWNNKKIQKPILYVKTFFNDENKELWKFWFEKKDRWLECLLAKNVLYNFLTYFIN